VIAVLRSFAIVGCCALLFACATTRQPKSSLQWQQRLADLQGSHSWAMGGRAAVALGTQGWQASMDWRQSAAYAEVHLSGPFGVGAVVLKQAADGLSLNGAPPSDAVVAQVQERLGFQPPLDHLRFWLLGVPDPSAPAQVVQNDQDRAMQVTQDGWVIAYDRYLMTGHDLLPTRVILSRGDVRVRIVVDHWDWSQ
jgi:outer membrane lipoprotein LolB